MEVEDIAGVCLASRGTAEKERHLPVCLRLLGEIVEDHERMPRVVAEEFSKCGTGIRCDILHRGRIARGGGNDRGIFHRPFLFQSGNQSFYLRFLLSASDIDAVRPVFFVFLIDDCVQSHGRLSQTPVSDNQFPLASSNRNHRINCFYSCMQRSIYSFPVNNVRRIVFQKIKLRFFFF